MNSFTEFVANKLTRLSPRTIDYKSIQSFLSSVKGYEHLGLERQLKLWIATMIDRGLTPTSRLRYFAKLSALYKMCNIDATSPFDTVRELCASTVQVDDNEIRAGLTTLTRKIDIIMTDAVTKPELALTLYLLFNASADIERAISLTTAEYQPAFAQLEEIIRPTDFHHRRRYLFDLGQSRKRMPQIVREVTCALSTYLNLPRPITGRTIVALWIAQARKCGLSPVEIATAIDTIPEEYDYLRHVKNSSLTQEETLDIKHRVAESLAPSGKRWYAIKLRRGVAFDTVDELIKHNLPQHYDSGLLFYPLQKIARKTDKKIETITRPVISDIAFLHISPRYIGKIDMLLKSNKAGYVLRSTSSQESCYSIIPTAAMSTFQHMVGTLTPDIRIELTASPPVGIGRKVVITGGIMAGYEGTIHDIKSSDGIRYIYLRLSDRYSIRAQVKLDEHYVKPLN